MKRKLLLLLILLSISSFAQFSKTHYIPPTSSSASVVPEEQFIYISTPSLTPVNIRIIRLGGTIINGTVTRDMPYVHNIGVGATTQLNVPASQVDAVMSNKGYIVEGEDLIYVAVRLIAGNTNQAGHIISKGLAALGTQFRVGAYMNMLVPTYDDIDYTFVSILATENNTSVEFSDIKPGVVLLNNNGGSNPNGITLNSGQSFVMAVQGPTEANRDGLIGALISSDKPIAVNCGSFGGTNGEMSNLDLGFDQIVSAERTGTEYIFIRSTGLDNVERILLVAHEDDTEIFLDGSPVASYVIDAGDYIALDGNDYTANGNLYVQTSKNVFAYQSVGDNSRSDQANQELFFVPPLSCETPRIIDNIPVLNLIGTRVFTGRVTIVTEAGADLSFVIDSFPYDLTDLPPGVSFTGPLSVNGNPDYETYIITGLTGNVSVYSTGQLYLASYGSSDAATFGGFYSGFTFKPEIAFDRLDLSQPNCLPNVVLSVSPLTAFDIFQWYFNDDPIPGASLSSYNPTLPGYYHVAATIGACGTTLISDKIPVSSCPTDLDNDIVNDNIDIDNDNDGITNCVESYGNQPFNLSNPLAGTISSGNYTNSFVGSFPPPSGPQAITPFTSAADGTIVTEVRAGKGNSVIYKMDFAQPLSFTMEYVTTAAPGDVLTSNSEFFISAPVNKTITVTNPTNQLLIDTNYDGFYESGITEFSSFEIRFRLNSTLPLTPGSGTFKFQSHLAGSFTYTHKNLNDNAPSKATFKIMATCLPKDHDSDGVPDQVDADSDNDGIPDFYESQGQNFNDLTNVDDNFDGLDDLFSANAVANDNDGDNIPNYLDLDSDNDGIFDLTESASNATDSNFNGIVDGNPSSFGGNGLSNALETPADSGIISYSVGNADGDDVFNYLEADSDDDGCNDVNEAGFTDGNNDGFLGNSSPPTVNTNGNVTGAANGYTAPDMAYLVPTPIIITTQPQGSTTCEMQSATITVEATPGVTFQWQVLTNGVNFTNIINNTTYSGSQTATLTVNGVTPVMTGYQYRVVLNLTGNICGLASETATLTINPLPPVVTKTLVQCDTGTSPDGLTIFNLAEADDLMTGGDSNLTAVYFSTLADAQNNLNPLPLEFSNSSNPQQIKVRVTNNTTGCFSISTLNLSVNVVPNGIINLPEPCDYDGNEDGYYIFDLTTANIPVGALQTIRYYETENDALLEQNQLANPDAYINLLPYTMQTVYARVENSLGCSGITQINIKVNPLPDIDVNADLENHLVCVNTSSFTTTLDAAILDGTPVSDYTYQWTFEGVTIPGANSSTLLVDTEGTYTVEVTNASGCSKIRTIPVLASSTAIIENIAIVDLVENNTVTVYLTSNSYGNYVYSIDYQNAYQSSNVLQNVLPGIHIVYVKDLNGCPVASQEIAVLGIPPYFTPNGDGFHDTWNVKGVNSRYYADTKVDIFDRYGKLLKQIGASGTGWDGTFNGLPLPSTDYWYVVRFGNGTIIKGHFALKR